MPRDVEPRRSGVYRLSDEERSEPQSELDWRPRAGVILCLKKK